MYFWDVVFTENRVRTGILGLDELIEGGLPRGFCYTVMGGPGSGKTLFGVQFLYSGATLYGENGIYVTLEEPPYSIANNVRRFGWDLYKLEAARKLVFVDASPIRGLGRAAPLYTLRSPIGSNEFSIDDIIGLIGEAKRSIDAKRCVIDSLTALTVQYDSPFEVRYNVLRLVKALTETGLTTLLLSELSEERIDAQRFGFEAFIAQGVIVLHMIRIGDSISRALEVRKMRGVKHLQRLCPMRITDKGIEVFPEEKVFGL